ncbi:Uncharacterised protein [Vibrio cholerae]|nr:Uncharacterised protein [Vibrio cholerae]
MVCAKTQASGGYLCCSLNVKGVIHMALRLYSLELMNVVKTKALLNSKPSYHITQCM